MSEIPRNSDQDPTDKAKKEVICTIVPFPITKSYGMQIPRSNEPPPPNVIDLGKVRKRRKLRKVDPTPPPEPEPPPEAC